MYKIILITQSQIVTFYQIININLQEDVFTGEWFVF